MLNNVVSYKENKLHMEEVNLEEISKKYGTPVYCYSTKKIADNFNSWKMAFKSIMAEDRFTICYACKANINLAVLRLLNKLGSGADVVSIGEIKRSFNAGIDFNKMVFSGVGKTDEELSYAIKSGLKLINIESESELLRIAEISKKENIKTNVAFRINPNVNAKTHEKITTGLKENKFGVNVDDAYALYNKAKINPNLEASGVSMHIGSQLTTLEPFKEAFEFIAGFVKELRRQGHEINMIDLGGGLGISYKDETPPSVAEYMELVKEIILPLNLEIIIEPGRSIVGNAGVILTSVIHRKKATNKSFLIIDAAMNDLMRPSLYDARHKVLMVNETLDIGEIFDIVGPVCETSDSLLCDTKMPKDISSGDLLVIKDCGAYASSMASSYNTRPLAPEVLVSQRQFDLIRKKQSIEDIYHDEILPKWLE